MTRAWDFVVAGAGPAGSRAAELLARTGASVLLFDPKAPWEKPSGATFVAAALRGAARTSGAWDVTDDRAPGAALLRGRARCRVDQP